MMMQDLEGEAEHGLITIDYNDRLKIARFKARVGRINERLGSALVQRVMCLGKLIRYQRRSIAQIYRTTQKIKNDKTILGFNEFSIQKPSSRQHPYDLTFQSMLRDTGNLTSVHKYAHIFVNGEDWGIMDIEESMSKELLEKQNRKNSVIVRFSSDEKWFYQTISKERQKLVQPVRTSSLVRSVQAPEHASLDSQQFLLTRELSKIESEQ